MIGYYTKFKTKPEDRDNLVELLSQAAGSMNKVSGCRLYEVALDAVDSAITSVNEIWTDESAHDASLQTEEARMLIPQAMPLLADKPQQIKLGPVITTWFS